MQTLSFRRQHTSSYTCSRLTKGTQLCKRFLSPLRTPMRLLPSSAAHTGTFPGFLAGSVLLHDTILGPSTQDVLITIQANVPFPSGPGSGFSCRLLRLGKSHQDEVGLVCRNEFIHCSPSGVGRAFYVRGPTTLAALECDVHADGHSGEAPEVKVKEYPSILQLPNRREVLDYDPYSGRICLRHGAAKDGVTEVLDLAMEDDRCIPDRQDEDIAYFFHGVGV